MTNRVEKAIEYNTKWGYNCSQAVALAYADLLELDELATFKAMEAFGLGMGGRLGTCGALSGAIYLAGFVSSTGNMDEDPSTKSKKSSYNLANQIMKEFYDNHGTVTCGDLKDVKGEHFTPCTKCIEEACVLVEKYLFADKL